MKIISEKEPLEVAIEASTILYNSVVHTLGPGGLNTAVVSKGDGPYNIINDGYSIIKDLTSPDAVLAPMLETLKQASFETNRKAGDGTTSTVILTHKLLTGLHETLTGKENIVKIKEELYNFRDDFIDILHQQLSRDIKDEDYEKIATVSLGSPKYATLIANAYRFLGDNLRPSIIKSDIPNVISEEKDGIVLDKADILFKEKLDQASKELVDIDTYVIYDKIDRWQYIQGLVQQIGRMKRKTILFYNELSIDILENLKYNILMNGIDIIPIRLGGYGPRLNDIMKEICDYTGSTLIDGIKVRITDLKNIEIGHLDYAFMSSEQLIINNRGYKPEEGAAITLPTKSCIIRVGGTTESEREDNYKRIEDAISSLGNAIDSGITVGGGISYQRIVESYKDWGKLPDYIKEAMESIYINVIKNLTGSDKIDPDLNGLLPRNVDSEEAEYEVPDKLDIWDATKVVEEVIINSFTTVAMVLTTKCIIHNMER